jgi:acetyl-CoA carboxylase alpha subunit
MPTDANRQFLDFEKPIKDLVDEIQTMRHRQEKTKIDFTDSIQKLEAGILEKRKDHRKSQQLAAGAIEPPPRQTLHTCTLIK